ncbi:FHA domain-containing protein [Acinetobacter sp. TY2]|uniref:FHA domain-containing protein n=1 Tax=unclassified Acinetobacter TaxID=196816 RepID=UPI003917A2BB
MAWKLEAADDQAQSVIVDRDMLVGRHQDADVVLQAADVSRRHAGLSLKDNALWVQDLNSSNGTFVNDVRIAVETEVKNGDSLSFASVQYTAQVAVVEVVQPIVAEEVIIESEKVVVPEMVEPEITKSEKVIEPAQTETQDVSEPVAPTAAQQMNTQGMPSLADRATETTLHANGMPVNVGVPKPAPIPSNVDIHARVEEAPMEIPAACVEQEQDAQKNVQVGLISIIVLVVLAIIAWLFFK